MAEGDLEQGDEPIIELLQATEIFDGVEQAALSGLVSRAVYTRLPAGGCLFRAGDTSDCLYVVVAGRLEVTRAPRPGRDEELVRTLGPGAAVGELGVLTGTPRSASAWARRETHLVRIEAADFLRLLRTEPRFHEAVTVALARQLGGSRALQPHEPARLDIALVPLDEEEETRDAVAAALVDALGRTDTALLVDEAASARAGRLAPRGGFVLHLTEPLGACQVSTRRTIRRVDQVLAVAASPGAALEPASSLPAHAGLIFVGRPDEQTLDALEERWQHVVLLGPGPRLAGVDDLASELSARQAGTGPGTQRFPAPGELADTAPGDRQALAGLPRGLVDLELIGHGGQGEVFRAREASLDRFVAVKVLRSALDDVESAMFERERRTMGRLSGHPHIATIYSAGTLTGGRPYIVMEYLPGGSLADRLRTAGPLPAASALDVAAAVADALGAAHTEGILHRDVKPGNVLFSAFGEAKLVDFGIAKTAESSFTTEGVVVGSLGYLAPEVLDGGAASPAADFYALGATLYELVSGLPPYVRHQGESNGEFIWRLLTTLPMDLRRQGIPEELAALVESAMARDPSERLVGRDPFLARVGQVATEARAAQPPPGMGEP